MKKIFRARYTLRIRKEDNISPFGRRSRMQEEDQTNKLETAERGHAGQRYVARDLAVFGSRDTLAKN